MESKLGMGTILLVLSISPAEIIERRIWVKEMSDYESNRNCWQEEIEDNTLQSVHGTGHIKETTFCLVRSYFMVGF
jgi:hypothetical protein